jgi:iron complex transport system substrate-binding protein
VNRPFELRRRGAPAGVRAQGRARLQRCSTYPRRVVTRLHLAAAWAIVAAVSLAAAAPTPATPGRIISLVPAITEMLFAIGAGPQVVGVSSYDREPADVQSLPRVGALVDPDLERILSLRPDLVVVYATQHDLQRQLSQAGIATFPYAHGSLAHVFDTMRRLGEATGRGTEAARVAGDLAARINAVVRRVAGRPRPRVLLVFGREPSSLRNIYASGGHGFLHDLLERAGGDNVFGDVRRESLQVSTEQVLARRPDVILELRADAPGGDEAVVREREAWSALQAVPAVRSGRVHLLAGQEMVVPGPRVATAAERLSRVLHPEAWR